MYISYKYCPTQRQTLLLTQLLNKLWQTLVPMTMSAINTSQTLGLVLKNLKLILNRSLIGKLHQKLTRDTEQ